MNERLSAIPSSRERDPKESEYTQIAIRLAKDFIYRNVDAQTTERHIAQAKKDQTISAIETRNKKFESFLEFVKGAEFHEQANTLYYGAWQAQIIRQNPNAPESLTHEDIDEALEAFPLRDKLVDAETKAIQYYQAFLDSEEDPTVTLRESFEVKRNSYDPDEDEGTVTVDQIEIKKDDIEALINDLRVRAAERIQDPEERMKVLTILDNELKAIIDRLSKDDWGKKLELQEIYLLRRLIHSHDNGHLVSINHGTSRQDFKKGLSVDAVATAAGKTFEFQLKTFKQGASRNTKNRQNDIIAETQESLEGTNTNLAVLTTENITATYDSALRRSSDATVKSSEAYEALQPLIDSLENSHKTSSDEINRLVKLLGLTEDDLREEQERFQEKHEVLVKHQEAYRAKERLEAEKIAEVERKRREAELAEEEAERQRIEARIRLQENDASQSEAERQRIKTEKEAAMTERQSEKEKERIELKRIADEREAERLEKELKEKKKEEAKLRKKEALVGWPPVALTNLGNAPTLKRLGLLPEDWKGNPSELISAKKQFIQLFAKPRGKKIPAETDKPNALFAELFPTKESIENPTEEDRERLRSYLNQETKQSNAA